MRTIGWLLEGASSMSSFLKLSHLRTFSGVRLSNLIMATTTAIYAASMNNNTEMTWHRFTRRFRIGTRKMNLVCSKTYPITPNTLMSSNNPSVNIAIADTFDPTTQTQKRQYYLTLREDLEIVLEKEFWASGRRSDILLSFLPSVFDLVKSLPLFNILLDNLWDILDMFSRDQ